jgi:hypothetical protein
MKRFLFICALSISVVMVAQARAVTISIFESTNEGNITVAVSPENLFTIPGNQTGITQEGIGILGAVDIHFVYDPVGPGFCFPPGSGCSLFLPINIVEAADPTVVSDTLTVTLAERIPNTVTTVADIHFRSDSLDEISPPCVDLCTTNRTIETGSPLIFDFSLSNLTVTVFPEFSVPEPGTLTLLGLPVITLGFVLAYGKKVKRSV